MIINGQIYRTHKLSRLYFRHIQNTEVQQSLAVEIFAKILAARGFIKLDIDGERYCELPKYFRNDKRAELNMIFKDLGLRPFG